MSELELERAKALALSAQLPDEELDAQAKEAATPPFIDTDNAPDMPSPEELSSLKKEAAMGTMLNVGEEVAAVGLGALEGIPFAKDIAGGALTLLDTGVEKFSENNESTKRIINDGINKAEEDHPYAFMGGEAFTSAAIFSGGKAAQLAAGGISALSRSEDRSADDILAGVAITGVTMGALNVVGKGASLLGKRLGLLADRGVGEVTGALSAGEKKKLNKHIMKHFADKGDDLNKATSKWAKATLGETDSQGRRLIGANQTFQQTREIALDLKEGYGKQIGKSIAKMDEVFPDGMPEKESKLMYTEIIENLEKTIGSSKDPKTLKMAARARARVDAVFKTEMKETTRTIKKVPNKVTGELEDIVEEVVKDMPPKYNRVSYTELHDTRKAIDNEVRHSFDANNQSLSTEMKVAKEYANSLRRSIDAKVTPLLESGKIDLKDPSNKAIKSFRELNKKFANMNLVEDMTLEASYKASNGPMGMLKEAFATRGLLIGSISAATGASQWAAAGAAVAINRTMNSPRFPSHLQAGFRKLSEHIQRDAKSPLLNRILLGASISSDALTKSVSSAIGELNLIENAVARNSDDATMKSDSLLAAMEFHDKDAASTLRDALESGDKNAIGQIMDQASKNPKLSNFIKPGLGWDGKVYSPIDKQILHDQLWGNMDVSLAQKIRHTGPLLGDGLIPQVQPDDKQPIQHIPRRKDSHQY